MQRETVLDAMRAALQAAGASDDCEIELPGFSAPLVPAEAEVHAVATQLDYDSGSGRFTAILTLTSAVMDPINLRVAGRADDTMELPVASARLPAGAVLRQADVHMARIRVALLRGEVAHAPSEAVGMQLRHATRPGQPLMLSDLERPALVERGSRVEMRLDAGGLAVVAQGSALESGATGERIRVMNPASRAVIEAVVTGPGQVRVAPDSLPLTTANRGGTGALR